MNKKDLLNMSVIELTKLKNSLSKKDKLNENIDLISDIIDFKLNEDEGGGGMAFATGTTIAGMGAVTSPQPGVLPGTTGTVGSGDIGIPLNMGGGKYPQMSFKLPAEMGKSHGARTGKKSRIKKSDLKNLKKLKDFKTNKEEAPKSGKMLSFDDFYKSDVNKVKR